MKLKQEKIEKTSQGEQGGGERTGESTTLRSKQGRVEGRKKKSKPVGENKGKGEEREGRTETERIN